jgi:uncharacterized RmlC-like cupin family protein
MRLPLLLLPFTLLAAEPARYPVNNDDVRVIDVVEDPHAKTRLHDHKMNRVMIYKNAGTQDIVYEDGKKTTLKFKDRQVLWSPQAGMHTSEIVSSGPVGLVEIELKKAGAGKKVTTELDPLKVDPRHYHLEFENDQVRVTRVKFGAHEGAPLHEHQLTRVILYLTDSKTRVTSVDGTVDETPHKAGDVVYGGAAKHSEINTLDHPIEVIVTELKY